MEVKQVRQVIDILGNEFDSHKFIREFILRCTGTYGELLIKHGNVTTAHAEIANYLRSHADELEIEKLRNDEISADIFGNDVTNTFWKKK